MIDSLAGELGLYAGTFVVCFVAGLVPLVNAEIYLIGVTTMVVTSPAPLPMVVLLAALGQMVAKVLLYYGALGALELPGGRHRERLARARVRMQAWQEKPKWILFASALLGLPPFYLVSLAAGALRIGIRTFCVLGLIGRILRFAVIVAIPWL